MRVVADSNVIFSALISSKSTYLEIFESVEVFVPDFIFVEIAKYESRIRQRAKLEGHLKFFTQALFRHITVIPNLAIDSGSFLRAYSLCRDIDPEDTPSVALSIDLSVPLWTNDKQLSNGLRAQGYTNLIDSSEIFESLP